MHALIKQSDVPRTRACSALDLARATGYRQERPIVVRHGARNASHRRMSEAQRAEVLATLNSARFCDQTPAHTYHALLAEGVYLASIRTMQRLLKDANQARDRRPIRAPQAHAIPRLQASAPNQVWTWDITKLPLHRRGAWLYLYVLIDLFSRYVVGWMIAETENSALACRFVGTCAASQQIGPGQLTVHQDRGAPMTANNFIALLAELKIDKSHSRPRVSNDNAFSEAHFKTLKTQPDYPARFNDTVHGRMWCGNFFDWYNDEHQHSGLNGHIPADVFYGRAQAVTVIKQAALDHAYRCHPERFVNGPPNAKAPPLIVSINPLPASVVSLPTAARNNEIQTPSKCSARPSVPTRIVQQTSPLSEDRKTTLNS